MEGTIRLFNPKTNKVKVVTKSYGDLRDYQMQGFQPMPEPEVRFNAQTALEEKPKEEFVVAGEYNVDHTLPDTQAVTQSNVIETIVPNTNPAPARRGRKKKD